MNKHSPENLPSITKTIIFRAKAALLQTKRGAENLFAGNLERFKTRDDLQNAPVIAESKTILWTENNPAEQFLLAGKIHNLRLAVKRINGLEIPADGVFSFWKHVGKTSRARGFVAGRELREGCVIPNIGGGLCQLSNALYDAALKANYEIVERHAHTQIVRGSLAEQGRDATVFWNYVDLRFKSPNAFRIEAKLDSTNLIIRFRSNQRREKSFVNAKLSVLLGQLSTHPESCTTCGVEDCFRVIKPNTEANFGRAAFLLDEFSPEFDEYLSIIKSPQDVLLIPLDGKRFRKANYAWTVSGFAHTKQSFLVTAQRSYNSRKLAAQGASRQTNLLAMYEKLAKSYAKNLSYDVLHVVVQQNLLPFLWREGVLGGRTFDVLMSALPMKSLQERLDYAKNLHPESSTLGDFRADPALVEAETEALKNARKIITPHTEIASLFPKQSVLLNWKLPKASEMPSDNDRKPKAKIIFPASTVGRKGIYELREALRGLDIKLVAGGAVIEDKNFWEGFDVEVKSAADDWLHGADLVVLPAFVEHKPRKILQAVAAKVPVVVSKACGLENLEGVEIVETGDAFDLRERILKVLSAQGNFQKNITHVAKSSEMFSK